MKANENDPPQSQDALSGVWLGATHPLHARAYVRSSGAGADHPFMISFPDTGGV